MGETHYTPRVRPIVLAGGLGTRLRPRTNFLPKPLLPIRGRPLLWYALNILSDQRLLAPIVTLDYKAELLQAFFAQDYVDMRALPNRTMAEAVLEIAEEDEADVFLGMSSDVLIPEKAVSEILNDYDSNGGLDTVLFVRLEHPGHKKWEFVVNETKLQDIYKRDNVTNFEKVLLLLNKTSLLKIREFLPQPISESNVPEFLVSFQTGWIMILKTLIHLEISVAARLVDIPVCNVNVPQDFEDANTFIDRYIQLT